MLSSPATRRLVRQALCFLVGYFLPAIVFGDALVLPDDQNAFLRPHHVEFLEDTHSEFSLDQALAQRQWQALSADEFNVGVTRSTWWLQFSLHDSTKREYLLTIDNALLEYLDVWLFDTKNNNRILNHYQIGTKRSFQNRPISYRKFLIPLNFTTTEDIHVVLRARSTTSVTAPLGVWQVQKFWRQESVENILYGIFIGSILLIALYNFLLFISTQDWAFFYYVVYSVPVAFTSIVFEGWGIAYLWSPLTHLNTYFLGTILLLNTLGMLLFTRSFLNTPSIGRYFGKSFDIYLVLAVAALFAAVVGVPFSVIVVVIIVLFLGNIIISLIAGFLALRAQNPVAKYYLIARTPLLFGGLILILGSTGLLQNNMLAAASVPVGSMLEAVLLSFALANRINIEKNLRLKADQASIEAQAENRTKTRFLASMSHEIRTPMNGVLGMTQLLQGTKLDQQQQSYLEIIIKSGKSLLHIINEILDLSKIDAGKLHIENTTCTMEELVDEAVSVFTYEAKAKNIQLEVSIDSLLPSQFLGDPTRIKQILINLIGNAIKFTEQGSIAVDVQLSAKPEPFILFSVRDSGIGIPQDKLHSLFNAFEQVDDATTRNYGGTGLGLTICDQLVKLMGGQIGLDSKLGKGSTFWFAIPLCAVEEQAELSQGLRVEHDVNVETAVNIEQGSHTEVKKVAMVVEDNEVNQMVVRGLLSRLSVDTVLMGGGEEALEYYRNHHSDLDLVFMDCEMPGMDGYECTRRIREYETESGLKPLPIYALSAHAMLEHEEKSLLAGMNGHISKPIDVRGLETIIKTVQGKEIK